MSRDLTPPDPKRFGFASFADLLPKRAPILGEEPEGFEAFRDGLRGALAPLTAYECVLAENLIAIEWELLQQRRMRDASLRQTLRVSIAEAVVAVEQSRQGKTARAVDDVAARAKAEALAERAVSNDPEVQAAAQAELVELGLLPIELMSGAYGKPHGPAQRHDDKVQELERRRRQVKQDYDALQRARPIDARAGRADVDEAEVVEG
jgi:hypothetical protein